MAQRPMARTDLRTKSTSTSVAYSFNSARTCEMLLAFVNLKIEDEGKDVTKLCKVSPYNILVFLARQRLLPNHDVEFLQLDVDGVVVLDEEDLHFVLEDFVPLLDNEIDVAQRHVLNFRFGRK